MLMLLLLLSIPSLLLLERRHGRGHWCSGSRRLARRLLWRCLLLRRRRLGSRLLLRGHRRRWRLLIALLWGLLRWRLAVEWHWRLLLWWRRLWSLLHPRRHSVAGWCQAAQWAHSRHSRLIRSHWARIVRIKLDVGRHSHGSLSSRVKSLKLRLSGIHHRILRIGSSKKRVLRVHHLAGRLHLIGIRRRRAKWRWRMWRRLLLAHHSVRIIVKCFGLVRRLELLPHSRRSCTVQVPEHAPPRGEKSGRFSNTNLFIIPYLR